VALIYRSPRRRERSVGAMPIGTIQLAEGITPASPLLNRPGAFTMRLSKPAWRTEMTIDEEIRLRAEVEILRNWRYVVERDLQMLRDCVSALKEFAPPAIQFRVSTLLNLPR
jgi:hypothetical protein